MNNTTFSYLSQLQVHFKLLISIANGVSLSFQRAASKGAWQQDHDPLRAACRWHRLRLLKCKLPLSNSGSHNSSSRALVPDLSISIRSLLCLEFMSRLPAQGDTDVMRMRRDENAGKQLRQNASKQAFMDNCDTFTTEHNC